MNFAVSEDQLVAKLKLAKLPGCGSFHFRTVGQLLDHIFEKIGESNSGYDFGDLFENIDDACLKLLHEARSNNKFYFERMAQAIYETLPADEKCPRTIPTRDKAELVKILPELKGLTAKNKELRVHSPTIVAAVLEWAIEKTLKEAQSKTITRKIISRPPAEGDLHGHGLN